MSVVFGTDFIPMVVLKNWAWTFIQQPELSNLCQKESWWSLYSRMLGFTAKKYCPVSLLFMVSKIFEKLVNNRLIDYLENCSLFSDFQYGFRSFQSTAYLLAVVSDRIARTFNRSRAGQAVVLDISKAFDRASYASLLHKPMF